MSPSILANPFWWLGIHGAVIPLRELRIDLPVAPGNSWPSDELRRSHRPR